MKRLTVGTVLFGLGALALCAGQHARAQRREQPKDGTAVKRVDLIKDLQKQRVEMLSQAVKILAVEYQVDNAYFQQRVAAELDLVNAELDYSPTADARIACLRGATESAKRIADLTEVRVRAGYMSKVELFQAKALHLDMQIRLLKEEQKSAGGGGTVHDDRKEKT